MLHTPTFRVLVVEDSTPVRRFICTELQQKPELLLVGEASDGLEAVQRAHDLQPDLVLVDIGLPKLNGLEAAKQIRRVAPRAKLLFASMETSPEVVQETLRLGGRGYVCKLHMLTDLLPAIETVLAGGRFVSLGVAGEDLETYAQTTPRSFQDEVV